MGIAKIPLPERNFGKNPLFGFVGQGVYPKKNFSGGYFVYTLLAGSDSRERGGSLNKVGIIISTQHCVY